MLETAEARKLTAQQLAPARKAADRIEASLQEARTHIDEERYPEATAALKGVDASVTEQIRAINDLSGRARPVRRRR